jgi:uncharacterized membrane protein YgdD (TMEM256/DUF423 family)
VHRGLALATAVMGLLAVALGAVGAHALKHLLAHAADAAQRLEWWETGARYHLAHALALGLAAVLAPSSKAARWAGALFIAGTALFSGSLYLMALIGQKWPAAVTPVGGLCLMAGWVAFGVAAWKLRAGAPAGL